MTKLKISKAELIFYTISGLLILAGLVFAILGVIGDNLSPDNAIQKAQNSFYSFRYFGLILLSGGTILITFTFLFFARGEERRAEREERRKQRLEMAEKIEKGDVINVESTVISKPQNQNFEQEKISEIKESEISSNEKVEAIKEENSSTDLNKEDK